MKKRKRTALEMMAAVRIAPVQKTEAQPYERGTGLQKFRATYDAEQEAEKQRQEEIKMQPVRAAERDISTSLRNLIDADIPTLYTLESKYLSSQAPNAGDGSQWNNVSPEEIRASVRRAFSEFEDAFAPEGHLTAEGKNRLLRLSRVNLSTDWTDASAWAFGLRLLQLAGELDDDFIPTPAPEQPIAGKTLDDLESLDLGSRGGRDEAAKLMMRDMQQGAYEWHQAFVDSLVRDFNHTLTDAQTQSVVEIMKKRNLNFCSAADWGKARRACIKFGTLPQTLRYPSEILDDLIEISPNTYAGKMELKRQERLLGVSSN
jgi:hypothetical protein